MTHSATGLFLATAASLLALTSAATYPSCWLKDGECLDANEGPLRSGVKPQWNKNVVGYALTGIADADACAEACFANQTCGYFTFYDEKIPYDKRESCQLVGFNVQQACYNLEKTCVLLERCQSFNATCKTCKTGIRPLYSPANEPATMVISGIYNNEDFKTRELPEYEELVFNQTELIVNTTFVCNVTKNGVDHGVIGAVGGYVLGQGVMACGGYSSSAATPGYQSACYKLLAINAVEQWNVGPPLTVARAYAEGVTVKRADGTEVFYVLGGYNDADGFLDTVEEISSGGSAFAASTGLPTLPQKMSHFCSVVTSKNREGKRYLYIIGGWNINYLDGVHRIELDDSGAGVGGSWEDLGAAGLTLPTPRADHACAEVQMAEWRQGIIVTGGNLYDSAWLTTVHFLSYGANPSWVSVDLFPRLNIGRHNHGLENIDMRPFIFGGWSNGAQDSCETMEDCGATTLLEQDWVTADLTLSFRREKFAVARVPKSIFDDCAD